MLVSKLLAPTTKSNPADATFISHVLLLKGGYINSVGSGIYDLLPSGFRIIKKIENIIKEEMDKIGGQQILMPVVLPAELWKKSGRYEEVGSELLRFKDRADRDMILAMTHEEVVVDLVKSANRTYSNYPFMVYQIQTKFRDEPRARGGLIRLREFTMKDAYSFHLTQECLDAAYQDVYNAYWRIFERLGLKENILAIEADSGMMGGSLAHEFMLLSDSGEDSIVICQHCGFKANKEVFDQKNQVADQCSVCHRDVVIKRGIEVGHIFKLGDKYTKSLDMTCVLSDGKKMNPIMGCYGIGVSRLLACLIENNHDEHGPIWPKNLAPWQVEVISLNSDQQEVTQKSKEIYNLLLNKGYQTIWDDRNLTAGNKFGDADLFGCPIRIIISPKNLKNNQLEVVAKKENQQLLLGKEEALEFLQTYFHATK